VRAPRRKTALDRLEQATRPRLSVASTPLAGGPEGPAGESAGFVYVFDSATGEADPGSGELRFNKATLSEVTKIFISEADANGNSLATFLATLDDSTTTAHRGYLLIKEKGAPQNFALFEITGATTDNGTWDVLTVTHIQSSSGIANGDALRLEFYRTGDKGQEGPEGKEGKEGAAGAPGVASTEDWKASCRAATTANITIATALNNGDTLDGVVLATGDRVLVKNQTTKKENGIWVVGVTPARATDADAAGELSGGTVTYVEEGTVNAKRVFKIITHGSITPGTTEHEWEALVPKQTFGSTEIEFPGGSVATTAKEIAHGLGTTPTSVILTAANSAVNLAATVVGGTNFTVLGEHIQGALPAAGTKIKIYWVALV
jgi:hypothetical protein